MLILIYVAPYVLVVTVSHGSLLLADNMQMLLCTVEEQGNQSKTSSLVSSRWKV